MNNSKREKMFYTAISLIVSTTAHAATIISQPLANLGGDSRVPGQSFTTPDDGIVDFLTGATFGKRFTAIASGNLFLLSQEYQGMPSALSVASPGFLAKSEVVANGGLDAVYSFTSSNQYALQPNTKYWLYSNASVGWNLEWTDYDSYTGGNLSMALPAFGPPDNDFSFGSSSRPTAVDYRFSVTATAIPEPAVGMSIVFGLATLLLRRNQRAKMPEKEATGKVSVYIRA
jgi:hypothetical protein